MIARLKILLIAVVAAVGFILGAFALGKRTERDDQRVDDLEDYVETKQEIDNVEASPDRTAAIERLRRNGWVR